MSFEIGGPGQNILLLAFVDRPYFFSPQTFRRFPWFLRGRHKPTTIRMLIDKILDLISYIDTGVESQKIGDRLQEWIQMWRYHASWSIDLMRCWLSRFSFPQKFTQLLYGCLLEQGIKTSLWSTPLRNHSVYANDYRSPIPGQAILQLWL